MEGSPMNRRIWLTGACAMLALLPLFLGSTAAQSGSMKSIVPGVWFSEGDLPNQGHCNNIFIEMKDYLWGGPHPLDRIRG
jgi:hypothetical protein